jgi:hypothetical protein
LCQSRARYKNQQHQAENPVQNRRHEGSSPSCSKISMVPMACRR